MWVKSCTFRDEAIRLTILTPRPLIDGR